MLSVSDKCFLLFIFVSASRLQCSIVQTCTTTLQNIATRMGDPATFTRAQGDLEAAIWQVIPSSISHAPFNITDPNHAVVAPFAGTDMYAADSTQLKILNPTVAPQGNALYSTAGLYILKYTNPTCQTMAGLVVVANGPVCTCNASIPSRVEYTCSVEFANNINQRIKPIMTWKNSSGIAFVEQPQPESLDTANFGRQNSTSHVFVANTDATAYECVMTFSNASFLSAQVAMNAPIFTASCSIANCAVTTVNPTTTTMETTTTTTTMMTTTAPTTTTTISSTTTTNPATTTAPLPTTAELLTTTTAPTSAATSLASSASAAPSSLPTTESSNESETQAAIIVIVLAVVSVSTLTLVTLTWCFCSCQSLSTQVGTQLTKPMISGVNALSNYSPYSPRGMFQGRQRFAPRRTYSYQI